MVQQIWFLTKTRIMSLLNKKEGIYENDILLNCFYKTSFHDLSRGVFINLFYAFLLYLFGS